MKRLLFVRLLALLFAGFTNQVLAEEKVILVAATEWRPYMSENLPDKGVIPEITRVAFEKAGYRAVFKFYPWKRLLTSTKSGAVDAAIGVSYTDGRTAYFLYPTQTIFEDRKVIFHNKEKDIIKNFTGNLSDLCPDGVGVVDGSYLEERLKKVECLSVDSAIRVGLNLKKLLAGRFKYLLDSETSIKRLLSTQQFSEAEKNKIGFYETPVDIDKNYIVFSKKEAQRKPYLLSALIAFDKSMAQMKKDGTYGKILRDHGM
jgi:polar amino acid transport system substrate-binding protein